MAIEGVVADPGAGGTEFGGDNVAGGSGTVFVPYTKLMSGADTSIELIGGDAANGLDVDVTRVSGTVAVSNAGLTELAAAINASSQMDVNIAASVSLAVTNAGITTIAGAVAGAEMQVDVITMPTVTVNAHAVTNAGTFATQVDGAALTALQLIDNPVLVDDAAFTPATSSVMMAGFEADEGSTDSVDEGDAGAARMTLDRKQITTPQPHTSGGLSIARDIDLDNGTLTVVKNSAGQLYGMTIGNLGTVSVFVKFYDAVSGTLGTGTPVLTITIPGNATDDVVLTTSFGGMGIAFATGICVGAGTGVADNDNTDPGANIVIANIYYK